VAVENGDHAAGEVTVILERLRAGYDGAADDLYRLVYEDLRRLARQRLAGMPAGSVQPTMLVHEVYLRLMDRGGDTPRNRRHFFFLAGRAMMDILIDRARKRRAVKRGGDRRRATLSGALELAQGSIEELQDIKEAYAVLEQVDQVAAEVLRLRDIIGLSRDEAAAVMDLSPATITRETMYGRAWLRRRIEELNHGPDQPEA